MSQVKTVLAIESSCDETAASICQITDKGVILLSNIIYSSLEIQTKYGGVVPEQAAREQLKAIIPVIKEAQDKPKLDKDQIDALAITLGPGLIGSLLVGVETAKTLALVWKKPLIPINHLLGHFYANWIIDPKNPYPTLPAFPCLGLLVSGGHTDLVFITGHGKYQYLGGTRDDAAGECFDKSARLLGLPYPGGPQISKYAQSGDPNKYQLPRPMINSQNYDFSFSGLKTAVSLLAKKLQPKLQDPQVLSDICACVELAIVDVLVAKTLKATKLTQANCIIVAGGVAANTKLTEQLINQANQLLPKVKIFIPPVNLCTDNAAMIASAALYNPVPVDPLKIQADPGISLSNP